ncbi:MAG: dockerin type I repeat-containing protein, partial [Planctomycetota bacterium]
MNTEYCFELPEDCDSAQELYDSLRTAMGTTTANGTSTIPDNDRTGLQAVVAAKNLGGKVDLVYRPDFQGPAPTPCDLFNALARGCDVVTYVGWLNGAGARTNGHAVTVVGAIKCGETVRIFYKDDASGDDSQGDGQADDGVKTATFEAGGPTGWKLAGMGANQWEGFMALCPKPSAIIDSILKSIFDSFALLPVVSTDDPTDPLLAVILDHAFLIRDNACRLVLHVEDMGATAPPELIELANCLKEMSLEYYFLAQLLFFDPTPETIASMFSLLDPIAAKSSEIDAILDSPTEPEFIRPDCNGDGGLDIADAIALLNFLFGGGTITCEDACDANDDGALNIGDAITILNALFAGGGVPAPTDCGPDPTDDALGCEISPCP